MKSDPSNVLGQRCHIPVNAYNVNHTLYTVNFMNLTLTGVYGLKVSGSYRICLVKKKLESNISIASEVTNLIF